MPKFFVTKQQIKQQIEIVGEDAKHIKTVLRKKEEVLDILNSGEADYITFASSSSTVSYM